MPYSMHIWTVPISSHSFFQLVIPVNSAIRFRRVYFKGYYCLKCYVSFIRKCLLLLCVCFNSSPKRKRKKKKKAAEMMREKTMLYLLCSLSTVVLVYTQIKNLKLSTAIALETCQWTCYKTQTSEILLFLILI